MKKYLGLSTSLILLVFLALSLTGCERERPAPSTPKPVKGTTTPAARGVGTVAVTPTGALTKVALTSQPGAAGASAAATPVPINSPTFTPAPPKPVGAITATVPAASSAQDGQKIFIYKIEAGDTLSKIAQKFNTTTQVILSLNTLPNPDNLTVGQELKIPGDLPVDLGGARGYTVQQGDTLSKIAVKFGVTVAAIQELNKLANPNQIYPGQTLQIPGGSAPAAATPAPNATPRTYTVQQGDTLSKIATRFGVTLQALQAANNLQNPDMIYPGQTLKVP